MDNLTNDAKYLLSSMYGKYVEKRKEQTPKEQARNFQNTTYIKRYIMPEWSDEDILDTCFELKKHGYISGTIADDTFYTLYLTTEAVAKLEVDFKDNVDKVLEFAAKIKSAIPFL
ncbi:hypothetical protein [Streptococcus suis]